MNMSRINSLRKRFVVLVVLLPIGYMFLTSWKYQKYNLLRLFKNPRNLPVIKDQKETLDLCKPQISKNAHVGPCINDTLVSKEFEMERLNGSKAVHEFMRRCRASKLISFPVTGSENLTVDHEQLPVPNIVHYVWYNGNVNFTFLGYLSFLSVHKYMKVDYIYLHGDEEPMGHWWKQTRKDVANVYFVPRIRPTHICGKKIVSIEHSSDIAKQDIIYEYGGVYIDTDVLVVKPFRPLYKYDLTMGRESSIGLSIGIMVGRQGAPFFRLWRETYRTYNPREWGEHSVIIPSSLEKIYPTLVHVDIGHLISPDAGHLDQVFKKGYDWSENYAVHIWKRYGKVPAEPEGIKKLDNLLGELMRYIYFGSKDML